MIEPLRLSFVVHCSAEHAFAVWTDRVSQWWPLSHTVTEAPGLQVVFEGRVGGRIFERTPAGDEVEWGRVAVWEPPARLVYSWHINADRSDATEVDVRFVDLEAATTRVEIEHRGWERLGARCAPRRDRTRAGWDAVLPPYIAAATNA
jgi:hypothetical protein